MTPGSNSRRRCGLGDRRVGAILGNEIHLDRVRHELARAAEQIVGIMATKFEMPEVRERRSLPAELARWRCFVLRAGDPSP